MKRNFRLTHTNDFARAKSEGQSVKNKLAVLLYVRNEDDFSKVAFVTSKKVGNAVVRNHVRRIMRACTSTIWSEIKTGWNLVFYARSMGSKANYDEWMLSIKDLLKRSNLINND